MRISGSGFVSAANSVVPRRIVLPLFAFTLFVSAGLLFLAQPMIAKFVVPRFGGSPGVWSICLVFFQTTLLLGYTYAHALVRFVPRKWQIIIHVCIVLPFVGLSLPLDIRAALSPDSRWPAVSLLARLILEAGPVLFAISSTAPLLQSWFADLNRGTAEDPYFLYASSNAGSLLALLAYPFLIEPSLSLDRQAAIWSLAAGFLAVGIALSGALTFGWKRPHRIIATGGAARESGWRERLGWIIKASIPSSLLLGSTTYITTDVASAPLLWVMPLAIYLLTFVLVFARRPPLPHAAMLRVMPFVLIPLVITMSAGFQAHYLGVLILHFGGLFIVAMVLHGELARGRPSAERLTEFYFFLSLGGVLGGTFNALLAPLIFPDVWEYPLALVAACLVKPATIKERVSIIDVTLPLGLFAFVYFAKLNLLKGSHPDSMSPLIVRSILIAFVVIVPGLALLSFWPRRVRFAGGVAAYLAASALAVSEGPDRVVATARSFFGVSRVQTEADAGVNYLVLVHGTTLHGVKSLAPGEETLPMAYYSREGPFGRFFDSQSPERLRKIGVIGLGAGDLACYAAPGQEWSFFEIDPVSVSFADKYFGFIRNCGNDPKIIIGDARLELARSPDAYFDLLILDAFSSDAIPMHLLTREAMALYLHKLAPEGVLLFHVSSRNLDLPKVVGALAADAGLAARIAVDPSQAGARLRRIPAIVVAMAKDSGRLDGLGNWSILPSGDEQSLWTDQRSDLLHVIRFTPWF